MTRNQPFRAHQLDANMAVRKAEGEWSWYTPLALPFQVLGFPWLREEGLFRRLPIRPVEPLPAAVDRLANCTAGGQIRFRTNADRLAIHVRLGGPASMDHMPATGQNGFDAYIGEAGRERYAGTSRMKLSDTSYECILFEGAKGGKLRPVALHFPLYQSVLEVEIGLPPEALVEYDASYDGQGRLVFYGTSITQGGCAGRPGLAYTQQLGRRLKREVVNLGFSGNGKGEPELARIIRSIERVDAFVLDYEANCSTDRYCETLEPFIRLYREMQPEVPILVLSRIPYARESYDPSKRKERIVKRDFARHVVERLNQEGDSLLFFGDGSGLLGRSYDECTVDGVHPNDLGFTRMAQGIYPMLKQILSEKPVNSENKD
ncbi:SGNH/GDSL hydrolase family protein [Paenibacillus sp. OAS669]|uniref:SGNH/GDSL hydrolase family protein n=1 Tax=Paenibacillus sp. OAS669 TaxID=2663821 RepID=UPI00178A37DA|nr:SGNH/GDSL hydrolase family protein [Paenibacillus sp. OAS669]MBE1442057.1 lysophospholipase L1-like esterase [Paenibacillus sp. OAS669]